MENPEPVEEVVQPDLAPAYLAVEGAESRDAEAASTPRAKSMHGHSDSMVTVRLSKLGKGETESPQESPVKVKHDSLAESQRDMESDLEGENTRPTSISGTSISRSESNRTSASITDDEFAQFKADAMDEAAISPSPRSSIVSSNDTPIQEAADDASEMLGSELKYVSTRSRSVSLASSDSGSQKVDWERLDKNEEAEERHEGTDESTAFLLARLDHENNALATDPKYGMVTTRERKGSRPPSIQQLKKLVSEQPTNSNLRYSSLPTPPPLTELEFWSALVRDYRQTAQRLPTLTANKIRQGVPPPLRGVVWQSIAGARDPALEDEYEKLILESSPYDKLIHKDIGRSFPGVDMFRDPDGEGQRMLSKVLSAYSLYDPDIGYCQGLGFVVGPLLMHMGDKEAFCTLTRLMDHYGLRSCFLPNLAGLHLRIYQFQHYLSQYLPEVTAHLDKMNVEPLYITQWFLSFFGVTCPIPMLIRLYDVILTEGASETLMRVALSLMRRNEKKILAATELEDIMQLLLSRSLWDHYNYDADKLIADFCYWTGLVTRESLQELETSFKESLSPSTASKPSVHTAAQRFLGRLWNSSGALMSPRSPWGVAATSPLAPPATSNPLRRTPSKQSMASTLNSVEGSESSTATSSTEATEASRQQSADWAPQKTTVISQPPPGRTSSKDKDLHSQIEDLLTALNNMQREHSLMADQLQREREERDEDRQLVGKVVDRLRKHTALASIPEDTDCKDIEKSPTTTSLDETVIELEDHFTPTSRRTSLAMQTKQQLREESSRWKNQYQEEATRSADLIHQLSDRERELTSAKENLREARTHIQEGQKEKQRLEKANTDLRARKPTIDTTKAGSGNADSTSGSSPSPNGLRELRLARSSTASNLQPAFSKRISSLSTYSVNADEEGTLAPNDALLKELANAKTAEAVARQELEEVKTKLESFRKLLTGNASPGLNSASITSPKLSQPIGHTHSLSLSKASEADKEKTVSYMATTPISAVGGFFTGWGKRTVSNG